MGWACVLKVMGGGEGGGEEFDSSLDYKKKQHCVSVQQNPTFEDHPENQVGATM